MRRIQLFVWAAALSAAMAAGCGSGGEDARQPERETGSGRAVGVPARGRVSMQKVELFDAVEFMVPADWGSRRTAWWADTADPQAAFIRVTRIFAHNIKSEVEKVKADAGEFKPAELGGKPAMLLEGEAEEPGISGKIPFRKYFLIDRLPDRGMLAVRITGTDMEKHKAEMESVLASFKIGDTIAPDAMVDASWQGIPYRHPAAWSGGGGSTERMRWFSFADPFRGTEYTVMLSLNREFHPEHPDRFPWTGGKFRRVGNRWESGDGVVDNTGRPYLRQFYHIEADGKRIEVSCWVNGAYDFGGMTGVIDSFKASLNIRD